MNCNKNAQISYKSSNKAIAKVSSKGMVTAVKFGETKIAVSVKDGRNVEKLTYTVSVEKPQFFIKGTTIGQGETREISLGFIPDNADCIWSVTDKSMVSIKAKDNVCKVTGKKIGKTILTAKVRIAKKSYTAKVKVNVAEAPKDNEDFEVYYVFFDTGETSLNAYTIKEGGYVDEPIDPQKDGYKFGGWYTDETYTTKFDFTTPITKLYVLHAKWIAI